MVAVYKRYADSSLNNFRQDVDVDFLKDLRLVKNNILITGGCGVGKTYLAFAILNNFESKEDGFYSENYVKYIKFIDMIKTIHACWSGGDSYDRLELISYKRKDILLIDEFLPKQIDTEREELLNIFDERYNRCLPTVMFSNVGADELKKMLGLRIADRLLNSAKIVTIKGDSLR